MLRPAILWNDQRTQAERGKIEATIGLERLIALTGNRALTGFTAPKLLWLRAHEPDVYERIARIALPKDYVRLRLTGEHVTDVSDASGTLLLDVAKRLLERGGSERAGNRPRLVTNGSWRARTCPGRRAPEHRWPPAPATRPPAPWASGSTGPARLSIALGTSGVVFAALDAFAADPQARVHAFCHAVPGAWHAMGVMLSAAGSLAWLRTATDLQWPATTGRWPKPASGLPGRRACCSCPPYLAGERTPHADPDARGAFTGLSIRHDRGALVRAVLEGVAFGLRDSLDLIAELGHHARSGGASPAAGRAATCGPGSSPRYWSFPWSASKSTRARRSAPPSSAGWPLGAVVARRACLRGRHRPAPRPDRARSGLDRGLRRAARSVQGLVSGPACGALSVTPGRTAPAHPPSVSAHNL